MKIKHTKFIMIHVCDVDFNAYYTSAFGFIGRLAYIHIGHIMYISDPLDYSKFDMVDKD